MEYNSQREHLKIPEYGRNVQKLIQYATGLSDKKERNDVVKYIVYVMSQMNPNTKNVMEYDQKLWDHLYFISDFKLEVDAPYTLKKKEDTFKKPAPVPYPNKTIKYRHYGKGIEQLIEKAIAIEEPEKRKLLVGVIANYMKLAYRNWNKENITIEAVKGDIDRISGGKLKLDEGFSFSAPPRSSNARRKNAVGRNNQRTYSNGRKKYNNAKRNQK